MLKPIEIIQQIAERKASDYGDSHHFVDTKLGRNLWERAPAVNLRKRIDSARPLLTAFKELSYVLYFYCDHMRTLIEHERKEFDDIAEKQGKDAPEGFYPKPDEFFDRLGELLDIIDELGEAGATSKVEQVLGDKLPEEDYSADSFMGRHAAAIAQAEQRQIGNTPQFKEQGDGKAVKP